MSDRQDDGGTDDDGIGASDEQALRAMFAALVEDAEPSALSALEVQRIAKADQRSDASRRSTRLRYSRNALIAAVAIGVLALVLPHLGNSTSESTAASSTAPAAAAGASGGSFAAAVTSAAASGRADAAPQSVAGPAGSPSAARAPAGTTAAGSTAGGAPAAGAGDGSAGGGNAASGSAASSGAMSSGAASSGAASSEAMSSGGASGGASSAPSATSASSSAGIASGSACLPLPANALAVVRAALPGYRGAVRVTSCTAQTSAGSVAGTALFVVGRSGSASCAVSATDCPPRTGARIPGTRDAFAYPGGVLIAGAGGNTVVATATAGGPDRTGLITAARALLKAVG